MSDMLEVQHLECKCSLCTGSRYNKPFYASYGTCDFFEVMQRISWTLNYWVKTGIFVDTRVRSSSVPYDATIILTNWAETQLIFAEQHVTGMYTLPDAVFSPKALWTLNIRQETTILGSGNIRDFEIQPINDLAKAMQKLFEEKILTQELSQGY